MLQRFQIAGLNAAKSQFTTAAGDSYFIPNPLRAKAEVGAFALVTKKHFEKSTVRLPDGTVKLDEAGNPMLEDKAFDRQQATFIGDIRQCIIAANEEKIYAGVDDAVIGQEQQRLVKEFDLVGVNAAELVD